jgi:putative ABC transport system permease protein
MKTFDEIMRDALAQQRLSVMLFAAFAALALARRSASTASTYVVAGRAHEMGVRMALGAQPRDVLWLVVRQGLWLLGIGLAIGIPASLVATRLLGKLLYGVRPADPLTFLGVTLVIGAVTCISAYIPARRATRVDPAVVLRM